MYSVNVRPRFADDIVVGMGCAPSLKDSDMLSQSNMLSGLGLGSWFKRKKKKSKAKKRKKAAKKAAAAAAAEAAEAAAQPEYAEQPVQYAPQQYAPQQYAPAGYAEEGAAPMPAAFEEPAAEVVEAAPTVDEDVVNPDEVEAAGMTPDMSGLSDDVIRFNAPRRARRRIGRMRVRTGTTAFGLPVVAEVAVASGVSGLGKLFRRRKKHKKASKVKRLETAQQKATVLAEKRAALTATYLAELQQVAAESGYPTDDVPALLRGKGFKKAMKILKKMAALKANQDIKNYKDSVAAVAAGGELPPAADAAASAYTGLTPDTAVAASLMPATYAAQEAGLPAYAQQNVEAYAQTAQVPYQLPSGGDMTAQGQDEDIVSPMDVEGAVIDTAARPETGIPSSRLTDEDLAEQSMAASDESFVEMPGDESDVSPVGGSMGGARRRRGLPDMAHAGTAKDIESLVDERAGEEDAMSVELARGRYPAMMVEAEQVGWPSKVGEGADSEGGWYGSDPALEAPESIEGAGSPRSMRQRMQQLETEASGKLAAGRDVDESMFSADESEAEAGLSLRERMQQMAAGEAKALTRYVAQKHSRNGMAGLGATPFGAQWAVQNSLSALDSREKQLMAADPSRLQALRSLNATAIAQIDEARKILEGPSAPITDELAAAAKLATAAVSYKAALDGALKALRPAKVVAPKTMPQAFRREVQSRAMSPLGIAGLVAAGLGVGYLAFRAFSRK